MSVSANDHTGLAWVCARRVATLYVRRYGAHLDARDLLGEAWIGIARAAEKFDAERGTAFSTYAIPFGVWKATECALVLCGVRKRASSKVARQIPATDLGGEEDWGARAVSCEDFVGDAQDAPSSTEILAKMTPGERVAAHLTILCGLTLVQAAEILRSTPQAVHQRRNAGLAKVARNRDLRARVTG